MSKFSKSHMTVDGNRLHMSMPFAKVDKSKRLVSGFATLDNVDSEGDVVLAEASAKAFARARGNIREMHQPLAVGRMVDFNEEEFFYTDPESGEGKFYRGIFVTARVSEGAEDTWKKVLDGTLTGFSIGGNINEATNEFVKEAGTTVRFIKDYDLVELSLVDNPANQLANVLSIEKADNGSTMVKGMAVESDIQNVFICSTDNTVTVKDVESADCPMCGTKMQTAGWFEAGSDRAEKVQGIITKFLAPSMEEAAPISNEGGVEMSKKNEKETVEVKAEEATPAAETEETETVEETEVEETETDEDSETVDETEGTEEDEDKSESPEEVHDDEDEISKKIDELHKAVTTSLEESKEETLSKVAELESKVEEATQKFLTKASELESKMGEFGEKLNTAKSRQAALEKMLDDINSSEAIRKSADLEESSEEVVQKSTGWNGAFSGGLVKGFSVDNL